MSWEKGFPCEQFSKDASTAPDIYRGRVACSQQNFRTSVPEGYNLEIQNQKIINLIKFKQKYIHILYFFNDHNKYAFFVNINLLKICANPLF